MEMGAAREEKQKRHGFHRLARIGLPLFLVSAGGTPALPVFSEQSLMRLMAHPMTHENDGCFRERRRLAGFAFRINAAAIPNSGRRDAGAPGIFGTVPHAPCGAPDDA
jgi:hypothetical protein